MVTSVPSDHAVEVNGIFRHVRDLHLHISDSVVDGMTGSDSEDDKLLIQFPVRADDGGEQDSDANEEEEDTKVGVVDAETLRQDEEAKGMYIV